jgi:hypothetical protein
MQNVKWHEIFANYPLAAFVLTPFLHSLLAIGFALVVKFFFVRRLTTLSFGRCVLADFVINLVSISLGIILIPVAGLLWQLSIGIILDSYLNIGTFNLGASIAPFADWTAALLFAVFISAYLETVILRFVFNQGAFGKESHWKLFGWLCVANAPVVVLAFGSLLAIFVWKSTHNIYLFFDFIGHYFDTVLPFAIGMIGLLYYPRRIAKDIESGKRTQIEGEKMLKRLKWVWYLMFLFGFVKITEFFR